MTIKYYTSTSLYKSFTVKRKNGWEYRVEFKHNNTLHKGEFITEDAELQELIQNRREFKTGEIQLQNSITAKDDVIVEHVDVTPRKEVIPVAKLTPASEVKSWNEAKDYLRSKGVHHMKLLTPEAIKAEAKKMGIVFPNL